MKIAFLMDRFDSIQPEKETTSWLMYECNQRGHTVFFFEAHDVYVRKDEVVARMRNITVSPDMTIKKYWRSLIKCLKQDALIFESLTELDALFLRKHPPLNYQVLEFLELINHKVFIINSFSGQIIGNSKLYTLNFPDIIPITHVSRDPVRLKSIIDDFGGAMVLKPLWRYSGEGVITVNDRDSENLISLINYYVRANQNYPDREPIMVQEYLEDVKKEGVVRILLLNGEILGAMRRKPKKGEFRTNIPAGARAYRHDVTDSEERICASIREKLIQDGLYFVGIDVINNRLVEIDCVNPGDITRINRLNNVRLEFQVIDFIERKAKGVKM